jgi:hypothetical protein
MCNIQENNEKSNENNEIKPMKTSNENNINVIMYTIVMDNSIINDNERLKKTNVMKLNSNSMRK